MRPFRPDCDRNLYFQDSKNNGVNQTIKAMGEAILGSTLNVEL